MPIKQSINKTVPNKELFFQPVFGDDVINDLFKKIKKHNDPLVKQYVGEQVDIRLKDIETGFRRDIQDSQTKTTEILAIFVALFTFVSIEFQIFRSFASWQAAVSLTLIILGALSFFVLLTKALIFNKSSWYYFTFLFPLTLIAGGIYFFSESKLVESDYFKIDQDLRSTLSESKKNSAILKCFKDAGYLKKTCFE